MLSCENSVFEEFRRLSARIGRDPLLVQGAGGNTSIKHDGLLWVKGSGAWLAKAESEEIFVPVYLDSILQAIINKEGEPQSFRVAGNSKLRPSIETTLHALLPQTVVLHVHSINAIARSVVSGGKQDISTLLKGLNWEWIPYRRPGIPLALAIRDALVTSPDVLVLANHGLVVGAKSCKGAESVLSEVEARLALPERNAPRKDAKVLLSRLRGSNMRLPKYGLIHTVGTDPAQMRMAMGGALYPDHVVYLGPGICAAQHGMTLSDAMHDYQTQYGISPLWVLIEGEGVVVSKEITSGGEEMLLALALVMNRIRPDARLSFLPDEEVNALVNWDAEKYRKTIDREFI